MRKVYVRKDEFGNITHVCGVDQPGEDLQEMDVSDSAVQSVLKPTETYIHRRLKSISEGGYGTPNEQFEIINEQGLAAWQQHCARIKQNHPKP